MTILLRDIWPISEPARFKVHFARWNGDHQPLEVWIRDRAEWQEWQAYRPARDDFNRPLIFSMARFYHEPDIWLFGGVFHVQERLQDRYEVALADDGAQFIGRLKLRSNYRNRQTRVNFENHYDNLEVQEILREPYAGRSFPGYENIDLSFEELEALVRNSRPDWRASLTSVKGIYLISDITTGKRYVGSAYGEGGVWSRWCEYAATGHGGNVELRKLVTDPTLAYCRKAFRFALLEHRPHATADQAILDRETFWKNILLARGDYGLSRN
ncbi:MAG: GIY-YIG nuclease family protein [Phenylobacterium sp.]|uniref:GIY-YIG nuclease family protein n=1 Tax=Phenylobacterium sp. TaxID=1871053 RepID=UPI0012066938|nr:GIY-YIG nuclease family protein [Phenylobacterium sp.]TAL32094.1 MAG: GIY-YIG nuclease family protein [Phenylobacterium sp.]